MGDFENLPSSENELEQNISETIEVNEENAEEVKAETAEETQEESKKGSFVTDLFDWLDVFVKAMIVVVILFTAVFKIATIDGESMENTVFHGEKVIISNVFYTPKQGDIVVVSRNYKNSADCYERSSAPIIKRVIATEGQTVDIDFEKGIVYVDGKALDEPYTKTATTLHYDVEFPITVQNNCVFLLGDNRNDSLDSRASWIGANGTGQVDKRYILGKVLTRIYPLNKIGSLNDEQ